MFLNAVILILQEILEAALLISVLLVLTRLLQRLWPRLLLRTWWVLAALLSGLVGAWIYASNMAVVSAWFDYAGQEVANAFMQIIMTAMLLIICVCMQQSRMLESMVRTSRLITLCITGVVALGVVREGSEIILYISGQMGQPENVSPVLLGALMAAGIGTSCGVFLYYGLASMPLKYALRSALVLLALFSGNMASQAVLLLIQVDWLPYTIQLWDSTELLSEYSMSGQLLYALIGYEATPSLLQGVAYLIAMLMIMFSPLFRFAWRFTEDRQNNVV